MFAFFLFSCFFDAKVILMFLNFISAKLKKYVDNPLSILF